MNTWINSMKYLIWSKKKKYGKSKPLTYDSRQTEVKSNIHKISTKAISRIDVFIDKKLIKNKILKIISTSEVESERSFVLQYKPIGMKENISSYKVGLTVWQEKKMEDPLPIADKAFSPVWRKSSQLGVSAHSLARGPSALGKTTWGWNSYRKLITYIASASRLR